MVWEQETRTIVMVTQCNERGRVKCHKYWPSTEPTRYGEIEVTLKNEIENSEWTEREFVLSFEVSDPTVQFLHLCKIFCFFSTGKTRLLKELKKYDYVV